MPKLDKNYEFYFSFLRKNFKRVNDFFNKFIDKGHSLTEAVPPNEYYSIIHDKKKPISPDKSYLVGPFQTFKYMGKDLINTFKPYKSRYHVRQDFLQPSKGVGNLLKGLFLLIAAPITFVLSLFLVAPAYALKDIAKARSPVFNFVQLVKENLKRTPAWILDGIFHVVRGITQLATTPLTWLIKIPIRLGLTLRKSKTQASFFPKIEDTPGIQKLLQKAEDILTENVEGSAFSIDMIINALHAKYHKGLARGQASRIKEDGNERREQDLYNPVWEDPRTRVEKEQRRPIDHGRYKVLYSSYYMDKIFDVKSRINVDSIAHSRTYLGLFTNGRIFPTPAVAAPPAVGAMTLLK